MEHFRMLPMDNDLRIGGSTVYQNRACFHIWWLY